MRIEWSGQMAVAGRVVLIGETQVGKTSIIHRFIQSGCEEEQSPTIGAVFRTYDTACEGRPVSLQIWDTAGQERYRALGPIYYRKSNAAIAVFDLTRRETLEPLREWIIAFRENADDVFVVVVGNKSDLEGEIAFTVEETAEWAAGFDADCIWSSAQTGIGVTEIFHTVCKHIIEVRTAVEEDTEPVPVEQRTGDGCSC